MSLAREIFTPWSSTTRLGHCTFLAAGEAIRRSVVSCFISIVVAIANDFWNTGLLNDLWMYNLTSGWWTWLSGSANLDQSGRYGSLRVPAAGNTPGGRIGHSMVIDTINRALYVFGGNGLAEAANSKFDTAHATNDFDGGT